MVRPGQQAADQSEASTSGGMSGGVAEILVSQAGEPPFSTCQCGHRHSNDEAHGPAVTEEDMKAFVMENWSPALQAAFGDKWREHFQPKADGGRGDGQGGALPSSHLFEGLVSRLDARREGVKPQWIRPEDDSEDSPTYGERDGGSEEYFRGSRVRTFEARSMEEELQHLEMTTGFSESLRPHPQPRRCVRIKRHGKPAQSAGGGNAGVRAGIKGLSLNDSKGASNHFLSEPPRGQKRSAHFLSDVSRQSEAEFLEETPEDSQCSTPTFGVDDPLASNLDFLTGPGTSRDPSLPGEAGSRPGMEKGGPSVGKAGWSGSPLHMAAATGNAEMVQQLLLAGVNPMAWEPGSGRTGDTSKPGCTSGAAPSPWAPAKHPESPSHPYQRPGGFTGQHHASMEGGKRARLGPSGLRYGGVEPVSFEYCTAMHVAAYYGHWPVIRQLMESSQCDPCQLFAARNSQGATALHVAAHQGHSHLIQMLGKVKHVELNAVDNNGRTALHYVAARGHVAVVSDLWTLGCNLELTDNVGWTALHHAAERGFTDIVGQLVIAGANVQRVDLRGLTAAHLSAGQGHLEAFEKLLMAGYDVDTLANVSLLGVGYNTGSSCLHLAAQHGHLAMVERLLDAGANPKLADFRGCEPLQCAAEGGHGVIFDTLLQHDCNPRGADHLNATLLHYAASGGNLGIMDKLLELGCDKHAVTKYGRSVLHYSAYGGKVEAFQMLVGLGCDVGHADNEGNTVWLAAAQSHNVELLRKLLEYGCNLHDTNKAACTALHYACKSGSEGNLEMVKLLVERGIDVEARCSDGKTGVHYATQYGHDHIVHYLLGLDSSKDLVNQADAAGWTPMHYAAEQGCLQLVEAFLQGGADVNAQTLEGWTALHLASKDCRLHIVQQLLKAGADSSLQDANGCTGLHFAARLGDMTLFQTLYKHPSSSADIGETTGPGGYTLLHYAVEGGNKEIVKLLLEDGMGQAGKPHPPGRVFTPLHLAARAGHADLVPLLLADGYRPGTLDPEGRTPLHCASLGSNLSWYEAVQTGVGVHRPLPLVPQASGKGPPRMAGEGEVAADAKDLDEGLCSALHYASGVTWAPIMPRKVLGHSAIASQLMDLGVDATLLDDRLCSALHYAAGSGDAAVVLRLIQLGCSHTEVDEAGWTPLMWAAAGGHAGIIRELMSRGADFKVRDERARGPLHWASERGHVEAVDLLVEKYSENRLDLHALDTDGFSAAQLAANQGHVEAVGRILDASRSRMQKGFSALHLAVQSSLERLVQQLLVLPNTLVDAQDSDGLTALHWAAGEGRTSIVEQLVQARADITVLTGEGCTALHKAASGGHADIVKILISAAGPMASQLVNTKSGNGVTAMQQAAAEGHTEVVDLLLAAGAAVNACPMSNATALYNAANGGHLEVVDRLVTTGADVDLKTSSGSTPLHAAASGGHTEVLKLLLGAGADVDLQAQNGCTALHNAAANGHDGCVEVLITVGCDVDVQNSGGNTSLHVAATKGHLRVVELLIAAGANVHIRNSKAFTGVGCAANNGHAEVVLRLVTSGAAWRNLPDVNVVRTVCRKTNYKVSHFTGLLELAEKGKNRVRRKVGAVVANEGLTEEEVRARKEAADAQMAALIEAEESKKSQEAQKKSKKKKKKKGKKAGGSEEEAEADAEEPPVEPEPAPEPEPEATSSTPDAPAEPPDLAAAAKVDGTSKAQTPRSRQQNGAKGGKEPAPGTATKPASPMAKKQPKAALKAQEASDKLDGGWTQVGSSKGASASAPPLPPPDPAPQRSSQPRKQPPRMQDELPQPFNRVQTPRNGSKTPRQQPVKAPEPSQRAPPPPRASSEQAETAPPPPARQPSQTLGNQAGGFRGAPRQEPSAPPAARPAPRIVQPPPPPRKLTQPSPPIAAQPRAGQPQRGQGVHSSPRAPQPAHRLSQATNANGPSSSTAASAPPPAPVRLMANGSVGSPVRQQPPSTPRTPHIQSPIASPLGHQPHLQQPSRPNAGHALEQQGAPLGPRHPGVPANGLRPGYQGAQSLSQGESTMGSSWQPLNSSLPSAASVNWSFQNAGIQQGGAAQSAGGRPRAVQGGPRPQPAMQAIPEPARQTIGFGLPRVSSYGEIGARSGSFDSSVGGHLAAGHPGIAGRMGAPSHSGSHDSEAGGRSHATVSSSPAAVPLGLPNFNIWGNGGASAGPNGFLGSSLLPSVKRVGMTERDMANAREAGYFCPLTKAVLTNPVVASDGYTYERAAIEKWMETQSRSPVEPEIVLDRNKELVPNLTMAAHIKMFYKSANL